MISMRGTAAAGTVARGLARGSRKSVAPEEVAKKLRFPRSVQNHFSSLKPCSNPCINAGNTSCA
jgi:hypothetical protein